MKQGQDTVNVLVCPCVGMRVCVCKKVLCLVSPCVGMRVQESTLLGVTVCEDSAGPASMHTAHILSEFMGDS